MDLYADSKQAHKDVRQSRSIGFQSDVPRQELSHEPADTASLACGSRREMWCPSA